MENEKETLTKKDVLLSVSIIIFGVILAGAWIYTSDGRTNVDLQKTSIEVKKVAVSEIPKPSTLELEVLPTVGVTLPVVWGDLGQKLTSVGVIDGEKFKELYVERGQYTKEYEKLLTGNSTDKLIMTEENAPYLLNLFWALGLANKNQILEKGEMSDPRYGGAGRFASTGGWTLSSGSAMDHFSRHLFFVLTQEQQALVDKVSRGIYRPCCNNSTHFPDCNHGMAMLGLLELMASQGVSETDMWKTALEVNSYWFPNNYLTIATYMKNKGVDWEDVNPQEMLGFDYSSNSGFAKISAQTNNTPSSSQTGSGCDVGAGQPASTVISSSRQQAGCGI